MCEPTKGVRPFVPLAERLEIVASIGIVDAVHAETTPDKLDAWQDVRLPPDLQGRRLARHPEGRALEERLAPVGVEVVYFPYTVHTSSTLLRRALTAAPGAAPRRPCRPA